jgi:hypothetical protein
MSIGTLLATTDARELSIWAARDRIYPFGAEEDDRRFAKIAAAVYQAAGAKVKLDEMSGRNPSDEELEKAEQDAVAAIEKAHKLNDEQKLRAAKRIGHNV